MYLIRLIRWLLGTVRFRLWGVFSERFLNLVYKNDLRLWGTKKRSDAIECYTVAKDYKQMRHLARAAQVHIRIEEKKGLPFFLRRYRKRIALGVGAVVFALFLMVMSQFTWTIEIVGNSDVPTAEISRVVGDLGIHRGAYLKNANLKTIEEQALLNMPDLSSMNISRVGSKVVIEVKEQQEDPGVLDKTTPCNLVATKNGRITKVMPLDGYTQVKVGEYVTEGQLLVSGIYEDHYGEAYYKHAMGEVWAEVEEQVVIQIPMNEEVKTPTGKVKYRRIIDILGFKIPLYIPTELKGSYLSQVDKTPVSIFGFELPINYYRQTITPVTVEIVELNEEQAQMKADAELAELLESHSGDNPSSELVSSEIADGVLTVTYKVVSEQNIAEQQEILR